MAVARTIWFSFHLGCNRSAVSLAALNVSPLTQTIVLMWEPEPCFSSSPAEGRSSPTNTPGFHPSSFILPSFAWVYIIFLARQVLLSVLSWCSPCTSVSEGIFLMYLWRETYSMSTYFSEILFSCLSPTCIIILSDKVGWSFTLHFVVMLLNRFGFPVMISLSTQFYFTFTFRQ